MDLAFGGFWSLSKTIAMVLIIVPPWFCVLWCMCATPDRKQLTYSCKHYEVLPSSEDALVTVVADLRRAFDAVLKQSAPTIRAAASVNESVDGSDSGMITWIRALAVSLGFFALFWRIFTPLREMSDQEMWKVLVASAVSVKLWMGGVLGCFVVVRLQEAMSTFPVCRISSDGQALSVDSNLFVPHPSQNCFPLCWSLFAGLLTLAGFEFEHFDSSVDIEAFGATSPRFIDRGDGLPSSDTDAVSSASVEACGTGSGCEQLRLGS